METSKYAPDLQHRDWLIQSTIRLVINIDRNVRYQIVKPSDNTMHLILSNITQETLKNLIFLTNTDQNNNYLYLENFYLNLDEQNSTPSYIFGLKEIAIELWRNSDAEAFLKSEKTHKPFLFDAFVSPITNQPISIDEFVDNLSSTINILPNTKDRKKFYTMVLNPDYLSQLMEYQYFMNNML